MKYQQVPCRLVILAVAFLFSGVTIFGQYSESDARSLLKGKRTIYITNTVTEPGRDYYSRLVAGQTGLTIVGDIKDADLVLDVAYDSDYGTDTPRGTRDPKAVSSRPPDYNKRDSDRQRYVSDSKVTLRVFTLLGNSPNTLVWKKSKKQRSSYGGMAPNMPASWERLTPDAIPAHNLPPKDVVPGLIKAFLKDFAKAQ